MHRKHKLLFVVVAALASATTAHAQAPVDVGGTFQQIAQAADAWIPLLRRKPPSSFTCSRHWTSRGERLSFFGRATSTGCFLSLIRKLLVISFFYAVLINGQTWIPGDRQQLR